MDFTIRQLFNNISPVEDILPDSIEYKENKERLKDVKARILEQQPEASVSYIDELNHLTHVSERIYGTDCFVHGFRMGAILMMEIWKED